MLDRSRLSRRLALLGAVAAMSISGMRAQAAPYASGVSISGTTVSFVLNEAADSVTVSFTNGSTLTLDGSTAGTKTFELPSAGAAFGITAQKTTNVGYTILTGGTVTGSSNSLSIDAPAAGYAQISDDNNLLNRFNSPRGIDVQKNPNSPNFGTYYVANSTAGTAAGRSVGDGVYAIKADGSDAFGYGNTAKGVSGTPNFTAGTSTPYRIQAASDGNVYVTGYSDAASTVWQASGNLQTFTDVLQGRTGPTPLPAGQNHGTPYTVYVSGSSATGDLTVYTVDEDLTTSAVTGSGSTTDKNSIWKYQIGGNSLPYSTMPTKVNQVNTGIISAANADLEVGSNGYLYYTQARSLATQVGLIIYDADGNRIWNSLDASQSLSGITAGNDALRYVSGVALSPDEAWIAFILRNNNVALAPLVDGLPDLSGLRVVDTGSTAVSAYDIAFDAAGNLYYVSQGLTAARIFSPGGEMASTLLYDGSSFSFVNAAVSIPEPTTIAALLPAAVALLGRRRRA